MENQPLVTVYITNYNYGQFIRQSIESVFNQAYKNIELLIIDDGSTDDSRKIIEEYAGNRNVSIIYQHNKGPNTANNIALRVGRGKYIVRLDADDYFAEKALEILVDVLESDPELGLVFPDYYLIDTDSNIIGEVRRFNFCNEVSLLDQPAHGACTMIRKSYLETLGGYDESYSCQDGYELWIKFINQYKVINVNQPLFYYRQHGNSLSNNENMILDTRIKIKENFMGKHNIAAPSTFAILPIRSRNLGGQNIPLIELQGVSLLERAVKTAISSKKLSGLVITSSENEIESFYLEHIEGKYPKVMFLKRPEEFARLNESLTKTIRYVLDHQQVNDQFGIVETVMTISVEYPFITSEVLDDAINTLTIFNADSLLSVRQDNSTYYQHNGNGLKPILGQEKFTKLEREALYKGVGGIVISKIKGFKENNQMLHGKIGHIVLDATKAIGIHNDFELLISRIICNV